MKVSTFWYSFITLSILTLSLLFWVHQFDTFRPHTLLAALIFSFMWLVTLFMFFLGRKAVQSSNKYMFIRLVIGSVMAKMMLILLIIVVYVKIAQPESKFFVLPFLGVYLIFSIFETLVLYKIALSKTASNNE